jgi:hypothetical protein
MPCLLRAIQHSTGILAVPEATRVQEAYNDYAYDDLGFSDSELAIQRHLGLLSWTFLCGAVAVHSDTMKASLPPDVAKLNNRIKNLRDKNRTDEADDLEDEIYHFPDFVNESKCFFETISLFDCPKKDDRACKVALGRGGSGRGRSVYGMTAHRRKAGGTKLTAGQPRAARERNARARRRRLQNDQR